MRVKVAIAAWLFSTVVGGQVATAQSPVTTMTLGPNQIGLIKSAQGITTRIALPETVKEIICGDLYDPASGKGSFVLQRSDSDVFLKPVVPKGISNLFVKTGEKGEHVFSFDLEIVPSVAQAYRLVTVNPLGESAEGASADETEKLVKNAQQQADDIVRNAKQQADRIISQANRQATQTYSQAQERANESDRQMETRAQQEIEQRFVRALTQGIHQVKVNESAVNAKRVRITLDPGMFTFDQKSYLRYSIKNSGDKEFSFGAITLEKTAGKSTSVIPVKVIQAREENKLKPGETIIGIVVFEPQELGPRDRLALYLRSEDNTEIAHLTIQ
jgi:V/A-type H+/Na+-transporting ATPase subunit G/H